MKDGSVRERILIAFLILKYGYDNVRTDLPIHEPEIDVIVRGTPIYLKAMTGKQISGVKFIWTVDREKAIEFSQSYEPGCDMLFSHINWYGEGGLHYFTKDIQKSVLVEIG